MNYCRRRADCYSLKIYVEHIMSINRMTAVEKNTNGTSLQWRAKHFELLNVDSTIKIKINMKEINI